MTRCTPDEGAEPGPLFLYPVQRAAGPASAAASGVAVVLAVLLCAGFELGSAAAASAREAQADPIVEAVSGDGELREARDEEGADRDKTSLLEDESVETKHGDDRTVLPRVDVYLPEGELDLRLSRLVKNAFFEGQIKYDFIDGDISAFLRYRYYGYRTIYQIGLFDAVEFENIEDLNNDFERVRGFLTLMEWPHDYHHRTFLLGEFDRLSSNKEELQFSNNRSNTFVRLGYQRGTPDDPRSNAIVGETRARNETLFTVHRKIGPGEWGFTTALTYAFDFLGADFEYVRAEIAGLKRFTVTPGSFVIARGRAGTFVDKNVVRSPEVFEPEDRFSIPRSELFRLGGRENLKGVSSKFVGTEVAQATAELFMPWFVERPRRFWGLDWETFYGVLYTGIGAAGFDRDILTDQSAYLTDVGLGFEAAVRFKEYRFFISGLVAQDLDGEGSPRTHFTVRSYH